MEELIKMAKQLTPAEKMKFAEMVDLFGGEGNVDKAKIKARILRLRKRKSGRTTYQDMQDMLGY